MNRDGRGLFSRVRVPFSRLGSLDAVSRGEGPEAVAVGPRVRDAPSKVPPRSRVLVIAPAVADV